MKIVPDQLVRRFFAFMAGDFDDPSRYERLVSISLSQLLARQTGSAFAVPAMETIRRCWDAPFCVE